MNSATSIEESRAKPVSDASLKPWHFFVLASLMAATAAVLLSRQTTPEHLILISLTIAAAGVAAAGFYRMLAPLAADESAAFTTSLSERTRVALEREKVLTLRSIKELEFDRAMGKVAPKDFEEMVGRLRARAMVLMKELDEGTAYRNEIERELRERLARKHQETAAVVPLCTRCGTRNDFDAAFCKKCGAALAAREPGSR